MEFFDEVVIVGSGQDSTLNAKDNELGLIVRLNEEKLRTIYQSSDAPVEVAEDGRLRLKSRKIFKDGVDAKAFAEDIMNKAMAVNRARRSIY